MSKEEYKKAKKLRESIPDEAAAGIVNQLERMNFKVDTVADGVVFQSSEPMQNIYTQGKIYFGLEELEIELVWEDTELGTSFLDTTVHDISHVTEEELPQKIQELIEVWFDALELRLSGLQRQINLHFN